MKLLLVTSRHPWPPRRGDQLRAAQMIDLLAGEHEITLLAPAPPPLDADREPVETAEAGPDSPGPAGPGRATSASASPPPRVRIELYRTAGWPRTALGLARTAGRALPLQGGLFDHPDLGRRLRRLAPGADLVVLQLARLAAHTVEVGATPLLVDLVDSLALNLERRAAVDRGWLRPLLRREAALLANAERRLAERAGGLVVVCARDRDALAERLPPRLAGRLHVVPLALEARGGWTEEGGASNDVSRAAGADGETGRERETGVGSSGEAGEERKTWVGPGGEEGEERETWSEPSGETGAAPGASQCPAQLAFTGNLGYFVNADALTWFLREVWPALRARLPRLRLLAAGDRPSLAVRRAVARLGDASGVTLLASPPNLRPLLAASTVAIAPLRAGSGLPLKILEAWSAGVPVVATPWAAAGTTARPGDDLRVAETPGEWVETLLHLLADPEERRRLAGNARRRLAADYSRDAVRKQWNAALAAAVG